METVKDSELLAGMNFYCFQHWGVFLIKIF